MRNYLILLCREDEEVEVVMPADSRFEALQKLVSNPHNQHDIEYADRIEIEELEGDGPWHSKE